MTSFTESDLAAFSGYSTDVSFKAGSCIFKAGSAADCCYFINQGQVRIELDRSELDSEDVLGILEAGSMLGEMGFLDGMPRSASAYAETNVLARKVLKADVERLAEVNPKAVAALYSLLGRDAVAKLRTTNERLADAIFQSRDPAIDEMVERAAIAQKQLQDCSEERVDALLLAVAQSVESAARELAEATVKITRIGNVPDKITKNQIASMGVYRSLAGQRTNGPLATDEIRQVTEVAAPVGVIAGIVPTTNPVATAVFKGLAAIKGRNALILSFPRVTGELGTMVGKVIQSALAREGAPVDLVQWIGNSNSLRKTAILMAHPRVSLVLASGGTSSVKAAYASGTPTVGVGAGNAPVLICSDADLDRAAHNTTASKAFDNGLVSGSESNLIVLRPARETFVQALERNGAAVLSPRETAALTARAIVSGQPQLRTPILGKSAAHIADMAGIRRDYPIKVLVVPCETVGEDDAYAREKMAPILSLFTVADEIEGIQVALDLLRVEGTGHTAVIYTRRGAMVERFAAAVPASRILVDSPAALGVIGLTTGLMPSLTLGCGTFGPRSTDNVSYRSLLSIRRIAYCPR
jgi:acetaldehyde dehydrogenase / alcohol dehydrogenase